MPVATLSEHQGVRYLHLGSRWVQGAMRIKKPLVLELEYVRRMMAGLLCLPLEDADEPFGQEPLALQLGLGAGSLSRFCHGVLHMPTHVVEINPSVVAVCRYGFHLPQQEPGRFHVIESDAQAVLPQYACAPWGTGSGISLLHVDLYDEEAAAPVLDTPSFYQHCFQALKPEGAMTVNLFGRSVAFAQSIQRIRQACPEGGVWQFPPTPEGNVVVLASRCEQTHVSVQWAHRAQQIQTRWGLPACSWLGWLKPVEPLIQEGA
jgi:spermidine synthase